MILTVTVSKQLMVQNNNNNTNFSTFEFFAFNKIPSFINKITQMEQICMLAPSVWKLLMTNAIVVIVKL